MPMSKTYIPKMGPKKTVAPPERRKVNYDNGRNLMTRNLKNWYKTHKDYYKEFKSSIEGAFLNGDEKTVFELIGELRSPILPKDTSIFAEVVDWVSNDLDATIAAKYHPFSADNKDALLDAFKKGELLTDRYMAILYWLHLDGGQMFMLMQMAEKMETQKLTDNERKWGEMVTESIVDKGVTTRTFNKRYWKQFFSFEGMRTAKKYITNALAVSKGKGGRFMGIYLLEDLLNGPDRESILKNIGNVVRNRKKDTDQFPDAGIGTERRPQQLYNNMVFYGGKTLTSNTLKRCENLIEKHRKALSNSIEYQLFNQKNVRLIGVSINRTFYFSTLTA
jgi:hypothetical protein